LGDVTAATTFTIGPDGSCTAAVCRAAIAGAHTVTGTDGGAKGTATLSVGPAATTTVVSAGSSSIVFGQGVTLTATVARVAPLSGTATGSVDFFDGTARLGTSVLNGIQPDQATLTVTALEPGSHVITAAYRGDPNNLPSTSTAAASVTETVACTRVVTGTISGGLNVTDGATCVHDATINGPVSVAKSAALAVLGTTTVNGGLSSQNASAISVCGAQVNGSLTIRSTAGWVLIGDGSDDPTACGANHITTFVTLTGNAHQVELAGNTIGGAVTLTGSSGAGPYAEDAVTEIEANAIGGSLSCSGNTPPPTDDGKPNTVLGTRSGQCSGAKF
jgi:hypothetical protein